MLGLARQTISAPVDPYALNPFQVQYRSAPADPAKRWAGFQSRVGTYLPTDQYHWWRFDITNRAEVQDAFWNVEAVADTVKGDWNGSWPLDPGNVTQAWRDAFMRCLNLHRYYYMGADATYLQESNDPTWLLNEQAGALIEGQRAAGYHHTLTAADMPAGFQYADEAIMGARYSSIGSGIYPSDITGFLVDTDNPDPGHRLHALNPGANIFALGKVGYNTTHIEPLRPYSTVLYYSDDTQTTYRTGTNFGNPDQSTCPGPPTYDPFDRAYVFPYRGYIAIEDLWQGGTIPFSIDIPSAGLLLDSSGVNISTNRDGIPCQVTEVGAAFSISWRYHVSFTVAEGFFPYESYYEAAKLPYTDGKVVVTVSGVRFSAASAFTSSGKASDVVPYIAASNPKAFQPHTISWTFTVFDPSVVQRVDFPTSQSELTNLSTRAGIGSGNDVMIAGFVVTGVEPLRVAIRAQGRSLAQFGIQHPAMNPRVEVYQMGSSTLDLGGNDDWRNGANWRLVESYGLNPGDDSEAVTVAWLMPGNYTAIVSDPSSTNVGIGVVEVFALDAQSQSRLTNVSTRAVVGSGENTLIGGFVLQKTTTVLVRTQGPSLSRFGLNCVNGTKLTVVRQSDHAVLGTNAGWSAANAIGNERLLTDLSAYAPLDPREAAQIITLPAGAYTALVESADGKPGIGLVEVFNVN